jgi:ribosomal-protein-alanine N-acetyltransferase
MSQSLPYIIRPMEPADVPTVAAIDQLSFPTPWLASSYLYELNHNDQSSYLSLLKPTPDEPFHPKQRWLDRLRGVLYPAKESRVIGYVGFRFVSAEAHISTIAVHPDWRNQGLGELLLMTAMVHALELGAEKVSLEVRPSNHVAQRLYRKYGFRFTGVHRGYYRDGEDAWLMEVETTRDAYRAWLAENRREIEARLHFRWAGVGQNDGDTL